MADLRASGLGGVPKGETADRPSSPSVGDVFYNGTLGCLEIYTAQGWVANSAPPGIPTIGTTTYSGTDKAYNNSSASVAFTPGEGGGLPNSYRATSSPGGFTGTASSSPITVSGLQSATAYTFSVTGTNNFGTSAGSTNSNSITANTVPQIPGTPVAAYASNTSATLTFTAGATGGSSITNYKYSTDGTNYTALSPAQTSSPLTITGLTAFTNYTFYIKAVNVNGDSVASPISNSVFTGPTVSGGTLTSDSTYYYRTFSATDSLIISGASVTADTLIVAGGGGAGYDVGGGGGGGGVIYATSKSLSPATWAITIGAGGSSDNNGSLTKGANGQNTTAFGLTALGGGGGGTYNSVTAGQSGGSGGGAGMNSSGGAATQTSGSGYTGYGNSGGSAGAAYGSGGGGGAGGVGQNNTPSNRVAGGLPLYSSITGSSIAYAGGGYGNSDGGAVYNPGYDLNNNYVGYYGFGANGTGTGSTYPSGNGGVVIVRYTKSQVGG